MKCPNCKEMSSVVKEIRTSLSGLREYVEMVNISFDKMENKIKEMENTPTNIASQASPSGETKGAKHPKECAYLVAGGDNNNMAEVFDKISNTWIQLQPMKMCRANASSILYNGRVLVTGGTYSDNRVTLSSIEQCSFHTSSYLPLCWSNLAVKLRRHCTVLYYGCLIVLGGGDGNDDSDLIYEIQLQSPFNTKILAKLPSARPTAGCSAVLVHDKIFIFGGSKGNEAAKANVTMYDITKNEFKKLERLPYGVCDMATVRYGENVVLVGGTGQYGSYRGSKNTVISYNIKTQ